MKRKNSEVRKYKIISLILFIIILIFLIFYFLPIFISIPDISMISLDGFMEVEVLAETGDEYGTVNLYGDCYELKAVVENSQAESIMNGRNGIVGPRPNAHDLFKDTADTIGIKILMVKITEMKNDMYFSKIVMQKGNTLINLDARPSDAVAIAVRTNTPIFINETLFKSQGTKVC